MSNERPLDAERSVYFQHTAQWGDTSGEEQQVYWLSAADLVISDWLDETFLIGASVSAQFAPLFENGLGPFPETGLCTAGMDPFEVSYLAWGGKLCKEPIDQRYGNAPHQRQHVSPDYEVSVTWSASFAEMLGPECTAAFARLESMAPLAELRVILYLG